MIHSFEAIAAGTTLPLPGFSQRNNAVAQQRALYSGDLSSLGVIASDENSYPIQLNWFRRVATFFAEFLYTELPVITATGNPRAQEFIEGNLELISEVFFHATIDMIRYGTGVVSIDPLNPVSLKAYQLDNFYPVASPEGVYEGAVIAYEVPGAATDEDRRFVVVRLPIGSEATITTHPLVSGTIGEGAARSPIVINNSLEQVVLMHNGYATNFQGVSVYDDLRASIGEMSRTLTGLSATIAKNQRPHLYGPDGLLEIDDTGKAQLSTSGSFFGLAEGDTPPGYLQWDSKIDAVKENVELHRGQVFDLSGLSRLLFSDQAKTGALTGIALKRLMLPFVGKLSRIQKLNERGIEDALNILMANFAANGGETITLEPGTLTFDWPSDEIFEDIDASPATEPAPDDTPPTNNENEE